MPVRQRERVLPAGTLIHTVRPLRPSPPPARIPEGLNDLPRRLLTHHAV